MREYDQSAVIELGIADFRAQYSRVVWGMDFRALRQKDIQCDVYRSPFTRAK